MREHLVVAITVGMAVLMLAGPVLLVIVLLAGAIRRARVAERAERRDAAPVLPFAAPDTRAISDAVFFADVMDDIESLPTYTGARHG